jgi:hypothetical protein
MARQVTCKICGSKILQNEAYCVISETKTGNKKRNYYCDSIEYDSFIYEKERVKKQKEEIFNNINEILGYECLNFNLITKELSPILSIYTYEEILECFKEYKTNIDDYMNMKGIDKEFNKIRYIFTVIRANIADVSKITKDNKNKEKIKRVKIEEIEKKQTEIDNYQFKNNNVTDFTNFF